MKSIVWAFSLSLFPIITTAETSMTPINPPFVDIPGVSQAVLVESGRTLYISGQVPMGPEGLVDGGLLAQADQAFANFTATLEAAGADWSNVARVTFYIKDYDPTQLDVMRELRNKWIKTDVPPASALIGVASLFHPGALIEIDGIAVLPSE
ncbi:Enamine deaminase RidA, house cleaning of reactive enamine intermediates, YjgF/YER057c/UK114 family [Yoonia rosea]|uniref:Enamine deaminase RidA, house cleaning of reactive enamine intermediates, YjgF/YER057c/UK114 family n=1 Tax=Yoonia rosea TaxID=287098 RepID=A0A1R3WJ51_9RHOB|nr:RidA family protein [Yoonia rosea]SIT78191.1 Enamine deaminase RidA, house cleaning of reactive enamine intermediates, YjgF/YER057c/UK114 family [Yoonia rosea]